MSDSDIKEEWKSVAETGYENEYNVSNLGRIKKIRTGIILKNKPHCGYLRVKLSAVIGVKAKEKHFLVHRLVAKAWLINNIPERTQVNHIDGNKINNIISNLEWCTGKENTNHAVKKGLKITQKRAVVVTDKNGIELDYPSAMDAAKVIGINDRTVREALRTGCKPKGFYIRYKDGIQRTVLIDKNECDELKNHPNYLISKDPVPVIYSKKSKMFIRPSINEGGYPIVVLGKERKKEYVHKLVAIQFIPNPNNYTIVNHIDHNKLNYSIKNLEWCTQQDNIKKYYEMKRNGSVLSHSEQSNDGSGENSEVEEKSEL